MFGAGSAELAAWIDEQAHALKHRTLDPVLAALGALPTAAAAAPQAAEKARDATLASLQARREEVRYADFLAKGYPIASGAVESAGKLVVEARPKGGGMHWAPEHVNPMVAWRTSLCSQRWAAAWPAIHQHLRAQRRERSRQRWLRRHPPAAPSTPAPAPATSPARTTPKIHLSNAAQRLRDRDHPKVVDGCPTPNHPWRGLAKAG